MWLIYYYRIWILCYCPSKGVVLQPRNTYYILSEYILPSK